MVFIFYCIYQERYLIEYPATISVWLGGIRSNYGIHNTFVLEYSVHFKFDLKLNYVHMYHWIHNIHSVVFECLTW